MDNFLNCTCIELMMLQRLSCPGIRYNWALDQKI